MAKVIVLMGAPGAGKGTQAQLLSRRFGWPQISTGDILREMAEQDTALGRHIKSVLASGQLVSDEILADIIQERTERDDCRGGYILDGFPRTIRQAQLLDRLVSERGHELVVINIAVTRQALVARLAARRICPRCGAVYNMNSRPPRQDELCDRCGSPLRLRSDDHPDAIQRRLEVYQEQTAPVIDYYRRQKKVAEIDGDRSMDEVFQDLVRVIRERNGR